MQMLAPYPPTPRPTSATIQKHLLLQEDRPESVQRPELSLRVTMEMLELKYTQPALRNPRVPLPVPTATPVPPELQLRPIESRSDLKNNDFHRQVVLDNSTIRQPNPLKILHGRPSPTPLSPTIVEREVLRPSKPRPAAHDTTLAAARQGPDQHPSTQGVDFSHDAFEPDSPFTRQYIDRLEAEIKQREARVAKEQRILQKHLRHREEADKHYHGPCPGEWPSEPTLPHSDIGKRGSRKQKGAVPRSTRAGVDTHARHNERASRLETVSLQRRMPDGLMLTLSYGANGIF